MVRPSLVLVCVALRSSRFAMLPSMDAASEETEKMLDMIRRWEVARND